MMFFFISVFEMEFLHLKSSDGEIFTIPLDTARQFGPIRSMLEALGEDNINPDEGVPVPKVDAKTLSKVIGWARQHATGPDSKLDKASGTIYRQLCFLSSFIKRIFITPFEVSIKLNRPVFNELSTFLKLSISQRS